MASSSPPQWLRLFVRIFGFGTLILTAAAITWFETRRLTRMEDLETEKIAVVTAQASFFNDVLHRLRADLLILSRQSELDALHPSADSIADLAREYGLFLTAVGHYDSIRLLGVDGRQLIHAVADQPGGVHIDMDSPSDPVADAERLARVRRAPGGLLMASGVSREGPTPRPILKFAIATLADDVADRKVLEVVYRADAMFNRLALIAARSESSLILLSAQGYWHFDDTARHSGAHDWQYFSSVHGEPPLARAYPDAWRQIARGESGTVRVPNGFFVFRTVHPSVRGFWGFADDDQAEPTPNAPEWRIVSFVSPETTAAIENRILESLVPTALAALLTWGLLSWAVAVYWTGHRHRHARLVHQATIDPLTGALNRAAFDARMADAIRRYHETGDSCALIFIDLDAFKAVNDTHGHDAGDAVLTETAQRIRSAVRDVDAVGRIGGDEFAVALSPVRTRADAQTVMDKIAQRLAAAPAPYPGATEPIRASLGLAVCPDDGTTAELLLRAADKGMYGAKRALPASDADAPGSPT